MRRSDYFPIITFIGTLYNTYYNAGSPISPRLAAGGVQSFSSTRAARLSGGNAGKGAPSHGGRRTEYSKP